MIYVAPIHNPVPGAIAHLTERLHEIFGVPVVDRSPMFDPRIAFDRSRRQYNSTTLLVEMLKRLPSTDAKLIGVTDVDLFIPVLTFVFGEAQLDGNVAITSSYRLRNSFYGLPDNPELLMERLEKESVHELGHTFNLTHCGHYGCVMHSTSSVEEVDLKGVDFCDRCRQRLVVALLRPRTE